MRRTKIVATLGPASDPPELVRALVDAGVDVVRLNASHSSVDELDARCGLVRKTAAAAGRVVAVMLDLPGPKLRLGDVEARDVEAGAEVRLVPEDVSRDVTAVAAHRAADDVPCGGCASIAGAVEPGDVIVLGDGEVELGVLDASSEGIRTRVLVGGTLAGRRGVTVRDVSLPLEPVTPADEAYLEWGLDAGVDLIAQSYVRHPSDVLALRNHMGDSAVPVVAKIELPEAVEDIDAIAETADAVMVARGDLGVASAPERVPVYQRRIVSSAQAWGKPVIIATQMLESMLETPRPTRAEASDVANSVFDSVDAVMLSGETAVGRFPVESASTMARIVELAEGYASDEPAQPRAHARDDVPWAVSASLAELARRLDLAAIVTPTQSGATARFVAAHRPRTPIVAVCMSEAVARRLAVVWSVTPLVARAPESLDDLMQIASQAALDAGYAPGSLIAITAGVALNRPGLTDLIHVRRI